MSAEGLVAAEAAETPSSAKRVLFGEFDRLFMVAVVNASYVA